jgi:hypothetical protein
MNLEDIIYNLKQQASIGLPIICFSITGNKLHITTKKVGSRFFEHLDKDTKYIEFRVKNKLNCTPHEIDNGVEFYDYIFLYFENNSIISISEFFEILSIDKISDIANENFLNNWEVIVVTRDPIIRLLSGYVELVDSMLSTYTEINDSEIFNIVEKYVNVSVLENKPFVGLKHFSTIESNTLLNYFSNKVEKTIITDEHTSNWNIFLSNFLAKYKGRYGVIDIDNTSDMAEYGNSGTNISNKTIYLNWLDDYSNRSYINGFLSKLNHFMVMEYISYLNITSSK